MGITAEPAAGSPLHDCARRIRDGAMSAREAVEDCLERAEGSALGAFVTLGGEQARAQADRLDARRAAGEVVGPLHGVPLCVKDVFDVAGMRTTGGTTFFEDHVPAADARVVRRLREAGAIVVGKTNLHEASFGTTSLNPHFGFVRNPHDEARIAGGSSGGTAAAVAGGICPAGLGGDTGGSIRIPASLCGLVGVKPSAGRTSGAGVVGLSWTMDVAGPMTRSVVDAALLLAVIAEDVAGAPPVHPGPLPDEPGAALAGLRLGFPGGYYAADNDPDVDAALHALRSALAAHDGLLADVALPEAETSVPAGLSIVVPEAIASIEDYWRAVDADFGLAQQLDRLGDDVRGVVAAETGQADGALPAGAYVQAIHALRPRLVAAFERALADVDVLVVPTLPATAPTIEQGAELELNGRTVSTFETMVRYTFAASVTGLPAVTVPFGRGGNGMPIGVQLIGRRFDEARLLRAARAVELLAPA